MNLKSILIVTFYIMYCNVTFSQVNNHPTLNEVTIIYRSVPNGTTTIGNKAGIKVIPEVVFKLNPGNIKKVQIDLKSNNINIATRVCYLDSITAYTNKSKQYIKEGKYYIEFEDTLLLKKYDVELFTEDYYGVQSIKYKKQK